MHVQIVTFRLEGVTEGEYIDIATRLAPRFAGLPGLLAKVWLESPDSGTYGAIYLWDDREAMDRFVATDLFEGHNPEFADFSSDEFAVLQNLTRATQPVLTVLEEAAPRGRAPARPSPAPAKEVAAAPTRPRAVKGPAPSKATLPAKEAPAKATATARAAKVAPVAKAAKTSKAAPEAATAKAMKATRVTKAATKSGPAAARGRGPAE